MLDTNIPPLLESSAISENAAVNATNTRWVVLFLISLMYLLTYMDRSNI